MKWWARRSLRSRIFVAVSALVFAALLAALGFTQLVLSKEAQRSVSQDLIMTGQVFDELLAERTARLRASSTLLASDFALKRLLATRYDAEAYDAETLASAALSYQERIGVELLWIVDDAGEFLAGVPDGAPRGESITAFSPLAEALEAQDAASAVAMVDRTLFQLVAVPVFGPDAIGFLVLGQAIDDAFAVRLKANTGSDISFLTGTRVLASSWSTQTRDRLLPVGRDRPTLGHRNAVQEPFLLTLDGERILSLIVPLDDRPPQPLYALVQGSYDAALAPLHTLQWRIAVIGAAALLSTLVAGIVLAGSITEPVKALVAGMREVLAGNLHHRVRIEREDEVGFLARAFNEMVGGLEERERINDTFGRFVSRDVAEAVLGGRVPLEGERREVTILFQDIRGFTALTERLDPSTLLGLLNEFFTEVVAAVEAEGGVVKQFTGDGVMALFGAPQAYSDHADRAVRAALGIVERLEGLNRKLLLQDLPALAIGVGIHTGEVVAGLIGPDKRVEYGVVGEAVNLANRIESLTKDMQAVVLVSKEIAGRIGPEFLLGRSAVLPVKGSRQSVQVMEVVGSERTGNRARVARHPPPG